MKRRLRLTERWCDKLFVYRAYKGLSSTSRLLVGIALFYVAAISIMLVGSTVFGNSVVFIERDSKATSSPGADERLILYTVYEDSLGSRPNTDELPLVPVGHIFFPPESVEWVDTSRVRQVGLVDPRDEPRISSADVQWWIFWVLLLVSQILSALASWFDSRLVRMMSLERPRHAPGALEDTAGEANVEEAADADPGASRRRLFLRSFLSRVGFDLTIGIVVAVLLRLVLGEGW